ncbi:MAG: histidinol dehydrogenase [Treponemataceae bacterium]
MPIKIISAKSVSQDFFKPRKLGSTVHDQVQSYIEQVKSNGDNALHDIVSSLYKKGFEKANPEYYEISKQDIQNAALKMKSENAELYSAIEHSYKLALEFAKKQRQSFSDFETELEPGLITGQKNIPIERAGLYVPAGRFPLISSLVMCAAPAKAAPCKETILCTPAFTHPNNISKPYAHEGILAAAYICQIDKVFALGGSQAIAAMAYGTQTIPQCNVIAGPGNKFVTEAKRIVFGDTGIDIIAGPTEAFIIADESANPKWVASDMLAQAEHDVDAQAVLVTFSYDFAEKVSAEIEEQLSDLPTKKTARTSIENNGLIIVANSLEEAAFIANNKAPEHLELAFDSGTKLDKIIELTHNYGTLFIGHEAAEVLGDYAAGLNHILPTSGAAKFTGGLSVRMFLKTVTTLRTEKINCGGNTSKICEGLAKSIKTSSILGKTEGLIAHSRAAEFRNRNS